MNSQSRVANRALVIPSGINRQYNRQYFEIPGTQISVHFSTIINISICFEICFSKLGRILPIGIAYWPLFIPLGITRAYSFHLEWPRGRGRDPLGSLAHGQ